MAPRIASVWRLAGAAAVAGVIAVAWAWGPGDAVLAAPGIAALPTGISTPDAGEQAKKPADQGRVIAKVTQPWPDAKELAARRLEAENLPLFKTEDPLPITITSDFRQIEKDRDPNTKKRYAGTLQVASADGTPVTIPIQVGSRGHVRLDPRTCLNVPLKLEFVKKELKTTVFEGQKQLKLIVSCWNGDLYEQYVVSEYLAYRVFNLFTPRSYRVRLVKATYVDSNKGKPSTPRFGVLIEDEAELARRIEGRPAPIMNKGFRHCNQDTLSWMTLLQFMVGNTDASIVGLHNVTLVVDPRNVFYPVAYDFDYAGLVDAHYAVPDRRLPISSVRERLYRGPCRTAGQLEPFLATFRNKRPDLFALVDSIPGMTAQRKKAAKDYFDEFYRVIGNPGRVKRFLIDPCFETGM